MEAVRRRKKKKRKRNGEKRMKWKKMRKKKRKRNREKRMLWKMRRQKRKKKRDYRLLSMSLQIYYRQSPHQVSFAKIVATIVWTFLLLQLSPSIDASS